MRSRKFDVALPPRPPAHLTMSHHCPPSTVVFDSFVPPAKQLPVLKRRTDRSASGSPLSRQLISVFAVATMLAMIVLGATGGVLLADDHDPVATEQFERQVRPLLLAKCVSCHGDEKQESNLRLDSASGIHTGGDYGVPLIVDGDPLTGLLWRAVNNDDDGLVMPPTGGLSPAELAAFKTWIERGAPWPSDAKLVPATIDDRIADQRANHWSLQPVTVSPVPAPLDAAKIRTGVDRYVQARMRTPVSNEPVAGNDAVSFPSLMPGPEADRATLIRRVTFDLLGLPPTEAEVEAFVADPAADAYERLVDRLLASPHHGERWARHWLDVARYADTKGYAFTSDNRYPHAWTYRDYVIHAFNDDVPYDRFLLEQLAADRLDLPTDDRRLAALGYLTVGRKFNSYDEDIDDQIDVVTRGMLGLTVACARCHDHKYDGIPTADYYSLFGVFASSAEPGELPVIALDQSQPNQAEYQAKKAAEEKVRQDMLTEFHGNAQRDVTDHYYEYFVYSADRDVKKDQGRIEGLVLERDQLRRGVLRHLSEPFKNRVREDDPLLGAYAAVRNKTGDNFKNSLSSWIGKWQDAAEPGVDEVSTAPPEDAARVARRKMIERLRQANPDTADAVLATTASVTADAIAEFNTHDRKTEGLSPISVAIITALRDNQNLLDLSTEQSERYLQRDEQDKLRAQGRKIDAIESSEPGAPPRAMVLQENPNAYNPQIFVRGNSGNRGESVPRRFVALLAQGNERPNYATGGRKELATDIVDPQNPLTARVMVDRVWMHHFGTPLVTTPGDFGFRSEAPTQGPLLDYLADFLVKHDWSIKALHREIVLSHTYRQASLATPPAIAADPDNRLLTHQNRRRLEWEALRDRALAVSGLLDLSLYGKSVKIHTNDGSTRRTVYAYVDRQDMPGLFRTFNYPNPDSCTPRRPDTTVPQQGLFWLNSSIVREASDALTSTVLREPDTDQRIQTLFRVALQRDPTPDEAADIMVMLSAMGGDVDTEHENSERLRWQAIAQAVLMTNEFAFVD